MKTSLALLGVGALLLTASSASAFMGSAYIATGTATLGPAVFDAVVVWIPSVEPGDGTFRVRLSHPAAQEAGAYSIFAGQEQFNNLRTESMDGCPNVQVVDYTAYDKLTGGSVLFLTGQQILNTCTGKETMQYTGTYVLTSLVLNA